MNFADFRNNLTVNKIELPVEAKAIACVLSFLRVAVVKVSFNASSAVEGWTGRNGNRVAVWLPVLCRSFLRNHARSVRPSCHAAQNAASHLRLCHSMALH
jgi:hypothetical protein